MEGNRSSRGISFHMLKILNENYRERETNKCYIAIHYKLTPPNKMLFTPLQVTDFQDSTDVLNYSMNE